MASVNKPILLDETGKDMAAAIREQTEILSRATITMNPADYIVDCEYVEGEVEITKINEAGETVTETITAVTSWYERYASGKVRQGGVYDGEIEFDESGPMIPFYITLNIPMKSKQYAAQISCANSDLSYMNAAWVFYQMDTTGFSTMAFFNLGGITGALFWTVEGMGAEL